MLLNTRVAKYTLHGGDALVHRQVKCIRIQVGAFCEGPLEDVLIRRTLVGTGPQKRSEKGCSELGVVQVTLVTLNVTRQGPG